MPGVFADKIAVFEEYYCYFERRRWQSMDADKKRRPIDDRIYENFYDTNSVMSTTEMTGLTPTPPLSEDDAESYSEIHGMPVPGDPPRKRPEPKENPDVPWLR
ncbi:MAG: hypothetical protein QMB62_00680 [Oscillospiraceae bacterium]